MTKCEVLRSSFYERDRGWSLCRRRQIPEPSTWANVMAALTQGGAGPDSRPWSSLTRRRSDRHGAY